MWEEVIAQSGLAFLGIISIILVARKNKWGFVFGLLSQPFWFITSFLNGQWGIFILSIFYTVSWTYGVYEWFFKSKAKKTKVSRKSKV
jgi:nicotinamide riboside transporter PnuC